jgi:hypothetical protein
VRPGEEDGDDGQPDEIHEHTLAWEPLEVWQGRDQGGVKSDPRGVKKVSRRGSTDEAATIRWTGITCGGTARHADRDTRRSSCLIRDRAVSTPWRSSKVVEPVRVADATGRRFKPLTDPDGRSLSFLKLCGVPTRSPLTVNVISPSST